MKRIFSILALLLLSACATIPSGAPPFSPAPEPPPGMANVYIYRTGAYPYLRGITVGIDGREIATFAEGAYTVVPLETGSHQMRITWPIDVLIPPMTFPLDVREGKPNYIKITSRSGGYVYQGVSVIVEAVTPATAVAEAEMRACCRLIPVRGAD